MKNSLLSKQISDSKSNFNYFFSIMIVKILKKLIVFAILLLINQFFDYLTINIITLLSSIYTVYSIYKIVNYYGYYLNDIQNTFSNEVFYYIIDTKNIKYNLFKEVIKYGK